MPESDTLAYPIVEDPASVDDLDAWIDGLTASAGAESLTTVRVRYGEHAEQIADLWLPPGTAPFRTVALIHGGGFLAHFSRRIMTANVVDLVHRGYAVWCPEYRRTDLDGGPRPTTADVAAALAHLASLAGIVDQERIVVMGHSAGGYLALWAARLPQVTRVVALGAVCDLRANALERDDGYARFMGGTAEDVPDEYAYLDLSDRPARHARQVVICGLQDQPHRVEENRAYVAAARARGEQVEYEELDDTGHFAFMDPRSRGWARALVALESFQE